MASTTRIKILKDTPFDKKDLTMDNNYTMHRWTTMDFIALFPYYKQVKNLFNLKHLVLQKAIISLGNASFYSNYSLDPKTGKMIEVLSKDSQGFKSLIRMLLFRRFPFLNNYSVSIYDLVEFYIEIPNNSINLYVPFKSFLSRDYPKIIAHTTQYYYSYYSNWIDKEVEGRKQVDKLLMSPELKKFKQELDES